MADNNQDFRWSKYKNGRSYFAIVNLEIERSENVNEIIENYSGLGYSNHNIDVGKDGMENWKAGLRSGLEFSFAQSHETWKINVNAITGKPITDTNPTIIGYTAILAFIEKTNSVISEDKLQELEKDSSSIFFNKKFWKLRKKELQKIKDELRY